MIFVMKNVFYRQWWLSDLLVLGEGITNGINESTGATEKN